MKITSISFFIIVLTLVLSCSDNDNRIQTPTIINPNGDTELALLMREMFDDGMNIRKQVLKGEESLAIKRFKKIHTAEATEPKKVASEEYKKFANDYLTALESLEKAALDDRVSLYQGVVQSCMNCHKAMCPGPMVKIKRLYISAK